MINYDRTPYRATGRHGSRVQRANHKRRQGWEQLTNAVHTWHGLEQRLLAGSEQHPWYDPDGQPIGMMQASLLLKDIDARRIGLDQIGDYEVSTVHMPDVFRYTADGQPLMFETMVFRDEASVQRYLTTTKDLARQQHAAICHKVRQESQGICPHSGENFGDCKGRDLCDCLDYPEHEHYRPGRDTDDEDRAELAALLGADMVGKLLADDNSNGNPNRGSL